MARGSASSNDAGNGDSPRMSKASVNAAVQASLALCATCDHSRGQHDADQACTATWKHMGDTSERRCECAEYWPIRSQHEEGYKVVGWDLKVSGSFPFLHKRRVSTEFWEKLTTGMVIRVKADYEVGPHGFRPKRVKGYLVGVEEVRPLTLSRIVLLDEATGEEVEE